MVVRSILVTVVLLVFWSVVIRWLPGELETGQGLWSDNQIAAENYLGGTTNEESYVALLGSSLSQLLHLDSVSGMRVYNLGLSAQGVGDGLNLLAVGPPPAIILIETNIILKEDNEDFRHVFESPARLFLVRNVPALRHRYQPVGVGLGITRKITQKKRTNSALRDRPINEKSLEAKHREYAEPVKEKDFIDRLSVLRERLRPLEEAGTKLVFFEAPVHPDLCDSPRARSIRAGVKAIFQSSAHVYVPQPDCNDYFTTDGHHLGNKSGAAFANWLKHQLEQI